MLRGTVTETALHAMVSTTDLPSVHQNMKSVATEQQLYQVVFGGHITDEYDLDTTKQRMAKVFHLDAKKD